VQTQWQPACTRQSSHTAALASPVNAAQGWHALLLKLCCCAEAAGEPLLRWLWLLVDDAGTCSRCVRVYACMVLLHTPAGQVCC
jgi:hypothetical protein